jgi:hypothetical protein
VAVTIQGDEASVDLSGCGQQVAARSQAEGKRLHRGARGGLELARESNMFMSSEKNENKS